MAEGYHTPPSTAIPIPSYNHQSTQCQDVRSVLNSSASFKPPSPAPRFNVFPFENPLSSFPASSNVPINSDNTSPRTLPVFPSTSDLAAHYGLPQNFPPPPRPVTRRQKPAPKQPSPVFDLAAHYRLPQNFPPPPRPVTRRQKPAPKQPSPMFDFDSIRNNYLTMLSQNPSDNEPAAEDTATAAPASVAGAVDPMQAIQDLLGNAPPLSRRPDLAAVHTASPEFQNMDSFDSSYDPTSPLFSDTASPLFNDEAAFDAYLTSPGETPYDDFATSPTEDSPFSDFLPTPVLPMTDEDMLIGPLVEGDGYGGDLFGGLSSYTYEAPAAPKLPSTEQLYTISPGTPALDSIHPSSTVLHTRLVLQPGFSDCLEYMGVTDFQRRRVPQHFIIYTLTILRQQSDSHLYKFLDWVKWLYEQEDDFASFSNYKTILAVVFGFLNRAAWSSVETKTGDIAKRISEHLSLDAYTLLAEFILVLRDAKTYRTFLASRGPVAQRLLDLVQDLLDSFPDSPARPLLSQALLRLSRVSELLPTCFSLVGLAKLGPQVAAGAFGDIWKGLVRDQTVSVKIMRLFRDTDVRAALKEFGREALIWRQLSHPNLLPFYGLYYFDRRLCLVSPWMENGHILEFLKTAPVGINRVSLVLDVAMGLEYLHDEHVVHGDLKGTNILVTPPGRACIADFGLSTIADAVSLRFTHSTRSARGGTARYQAPELLMGEMHNHYGSDVYAFGCVGYEILTGKAPFYEFMNNMAVSIKVISGSRPSRPDPGPSEMLWRLLLDCWEQDSAKRPKVAAITQRLVSLHIGERKWQDAAHWDETFNPKFRRSLHDWPLLPPVDRIRQMVFVYNNAEDIPRDQYYQMPSTSTESPNFPLIRAASLPVAGISVLQSIMAGNEDLEESAERGRKRRLESPGAQELRLTKKPKL